MQLPRMRTIKEAAEEIKLADPQSAVKEYFIRDLVVNNKISSVRAGRKVLINLDKLFEYLRDGGELLADEEREKITGIRKIKE